jgi:hypothetical protein
MEKWIANLKSWKTSVAGVLSALILILPELLALVDSDPATICNWATVKIGLAALGLGVFAKDGDKTSGEVGLYKGDI